MKRSRFELRCQFTKYTQFLGRRSNVTFGNGTSQALAFDNADRLTTLTTNLANTVHDVQTTFAYNHPASQIASQSRNQPDHDNEPGEC